MTPPCLPPSLVYNGAFTLAARITFDFLLMKGPLALAAASGSHQVVSELMRADVPYRTRDREGRTPLHHAAAGGHISVLRVLVAEMRRGKGRSVAGPGGAVGPGAAAGGAGGGEEGVGGGDDVDEKKSVTMRDHSLMMDGGPFK